MRHINSAEDLEPQSEGFFNRGAETINIIGNVFEDILNSFGEAISGITGQKHRTNVDLSGLDPFNPLNVNDPDPDNARADAIRAERFIENNPRDL